MPKSTGIFLIFSLLSAIILFVLTDTYKEASQNIIDKILLIFLILLVGSWVLNFISKIIMGTAPDSKRVKIKKKKKVKKEKISEELTPIQYVLFYPIAVFGFWILLGMMSSRFVP